MFQTMFSTQSVHHTAIADQLLRGDDKLLFQSTDLDEVRLRVGNVMKPHQLTVAGLSDRLDARMHHTAIGDISVSRLRYGAAVHIELGPLQDCFLVQMPLQGGAHIQSGGRSLDSSSELASVLSPEDSTQMKWGAGTDQLMLRISRSLVERSLVGQLGHPLTKPLQFELGFRWRDSKPWLCLLPYIVDCVSSCPDLMQNKLVVSQLEQLVASVLLTSHRHSYSDLAPSRRCTILPRHIRRAEDYLRTNIHEPITVDQVAQVAGVSERSLYAGFKEFLGVSPMQFLRDIRMDRARTELLSGEVGNVAGVALRWGFGHMGRFSTEYKKRYGEAPSQTLRRC